MVKKIHFDLMVLNSVFSFPDLVKQQFMGLEILILTDYRRSRPEVFCKQSVLQIFEEITGKTKCRSLFLNEVAGFRPTALLKKSLWHRCFPVNVADFLRTPFLMEHLWWLLRGLTSRLEGEQASSTDKANMTS